MEGEQLRRNMLRALLEENLSNLDGKLNYRFSIHKISDCYRGIEDTEFSLKAISEYLEESRGYSRISQYIVGAPRILLKKQNRFLSVSAFPTNEKITFSVAKFDCERKNEN